ncbi:MAG: lysoplasmalogenase [Bacteroidetes bacterium]|nr:MAG: lysoplasmalogenase [Bacteroidota bacterium]
MKKSTKIFIWLYWFAVLADLFIVYKGYSTARYFSKPLLMVFLMLAYYFETKASGSFSKILLGGLFFSWLGDIILLNDDYFIVGLICFLITHIIYISYFVSINKKAKGLLQFQPLIGIPVAVYLLLFLWLLWPFLDKLRIPVVFYGFVICFMLICAINLYWKTDRDTAVLFFNGALQFLISDSLLAVHKFVYPFTALPIAVMITYTSAQFLIAQGSINHIGSNTGITSEN